MSSEIEVGQVLDNRFRITELISRSGIAAVSIFKAQDMQSDKAVAIKIPFMQFESDPAFFSRFQREEAIGRTLLTIRTSCRCSGRREKSPLYRDGVLAGANMSSSAAERGTHPPCGADDPRALHEDLARLVVDHHRIALAVARLDVGEAVGCSGMGRSGLLRSCRRWRAARLAAPRAHHGALGADEVAEVDVLGPRSASRRGRRAGRRAGARGSRP